MANFNNVSAPDIPGPLTTWEAKVISAGVSFVIIGGCAALPALISAWFYNSGTRGITAMRLCRSFGGGTFLGAFLMMLLPEADHLMQRLAKQGIVFAFPLTHFCSGVGFFFMMIVETLVTRLTSFTSTDSSLQIVGHHNPTATDDNENPVEIKSIKPINKSESSVDLMKVEHEQHKINNTVAGSSKATRTSLVQSIILFLALSLDSIIEGMALGVQESLAGVWNLLVAILSHEFIISFTLGLQLIPNNSRTRVICLAFLYGIMEPIGVAIGTLVYELYSSNSHDLVSAVLQSIAGGVFVYVTFFAILQEEIASHMPIKCIIVFALGFALAAALSVLEYHPYESFHTNSTLH